MNSQERNALPLSVKTFYDMHYDNVKAYIFLHLKNCGLSKSEISWTLLMNIVVRMFDNLKPKIHEANKNKWSF